MKRACKLLAGMLLGVALVLGGLAWGLRAAIAPQPGEWAIPLRMGPLTLQAGVPTLLRLATAPWAGHLLHGRRLQTPAGPVQLAWQAQERMLAVRCAPCRIPVPALGSEPLQVAEATLHVRRTWLLLDGTLEAGALRFAWTGEFAGGGLRLQAQLPATPLRDVYALFAAQVPEARRATIAGSLRLELKLDLPHGPTQVLPQVEGFEVRGLGTEAFASARSSCSRKPARLPADSWLARAVIAAEDQRFHEHPGYDLAELVAAFDANGSRGRIVRGGSTLGQQLAKLLVTGDRRDPARKLRELLYAVEMERTLGKARILHLYLENAPWGEGVCGAEAAARRYLGVRAAELTPQQAVWLAALLHNPGLEAQRTLPDGARLARIAMSLTGLSRARRAVLAEDFASGAWRPPQ